jgi:aldehyde dehydrogenase
MARGSGPLPPGTLGDPACAGHRNAWGQTPPAGLEIANDTLYGLGAGVWTRDGSRAFRVGRAVKAGRVWTNCYHQYPAGAAFGGYKISGIGRETHKMMLEHYSQTKNLLVSYGTKPLGFF